MTRYLLSRLPAALGVIVVGTIIVFALLRLIPGDPAASLAGPDAPPETVAALRSQLGLDEPAVTQYLHWIGGLLTGDPGQSLVLGGSVASLLGAAVGNTLVLTGAALVLALLFTALFSVAPEPVRTAFSSLAVAVPNFVTGTVGLILVGVVWAILPAGGVPRNGLLDDPWITAQYLLLPATCLALPVAATLTRYLADAVASELTQPYVTTATATGQSHRRILLTQVLPNALPPALTVLGMQIGQLLGGAVIVEFLFAWPGLGYLAQQAVTQRDYPVVQVLLLASVVTFVLIQLLTDLAHAALDPRIRLTAPTGATA
ncbi:ABC transporter permease [Corynebacterium terpenotabidum]|uniref:Oligopeptide/dipeptide ABC transporter transmembrane protein n=1 Tax=Corynebacterium terpenotabidum Y-11 TaxID=1200352 RepID=S4XG92_9CORY|nr:ABC transporter permease [Corynebacterium terpenotabidum]AGP29678.1 oligopeptide/dipeptide ABC transporter transmembrane protein [Corynebacterium terpenotabidum Y-11]